jgi:hypothetical protein
LISKKQSESWRKLSRVPEREFEAAIADKTAMPTTTTVGERSGDRAAGAMWATRSLPISERSWHRHKPQPQLRIANDLASSERRRR